MPTTTIHIRDDLLERIDEIVKKKGISRNKFIIEACERSVREEGGHWPEGFFEMELSHQDLELLREAAKEMEKEILLHRKSRKAADI